MKIVADENIPLIHEFFDSLGEVVTVAPRQLNHEHSKEADILVVRSIVPIGPSLLEDSAVKFVGTCTAGVDHLDRQFMDDHGIRWSGAPGCNAEAVVNYVFSTLAALDLNFLSASVGIIGCGHVGGRLLSRLDALGVNCLCYDPLLNSDQQPRLSDLSAVLESDIICIHAPLTTCGAHPSYHLLGTEELAQLKPGASLISAGRGGVIDNQALGERLQSGDDLQVVLDVWESEPDIDRELFDRVTLGTPHIAGHSYDGKAKGTEMIYQKVCEFLGRPIQRSFADLDDFKAPQIALQQYEPLQAIREAVLSVYDVREDHHRLKLALQENVSSRQAFDKLRKNYPVRREFANYRVKLARPDQGLAEKLKVIGFSVEGYTAEMRS